MRIIEVQQQSEEWERWRNRPTASQFGRFITPVRGDYAASASDYASEIVTKQLGAHVEAPPSFWMEWGTENEPNARYAYTLETGREVQEVGFVIPDHTDSYGGSPDGLVSDDGLLEIKCVKPPKLVRWRADKILPVEHKPQVQGLLFITGRAWLDFYAWHPLLKPFLIRVEPDLKYHEKIADGLLKLLQEIERLKAHNEPMRHRLITPIDEPLRWKDE